ncbi:TraB/GumN family protein [Pontiella sp.]|uniref:TraB/GumN family protein n=1 Tax=Pontiella sp. TaxID=2837462 RepID=UPI0035636192
MKTRRIRPVPAAALLLLSLATLSASAANCLWKATSKKGTFYIQGSSHVLKAANYPLDPAIEAAYSNATVLVLEVDMADMMSPKTQQLILGKAMLAPPAKLESVLDASTYENLAAACKEAGLPMEAVQPFKPWFATTTLMLLKMQQMGLSAEHGLDKHFYDKAVTDQKRIVGLETLDYQISLFDSLSEANPNDFVNRALIDLELMEGELEKLLTAWKTGDIGTLGEMLTKSFEDFPEIHDRFITARNKKWADALAKMAKNEETYLIVVGAGHLPGKTGLLELLGEKGFDLEQH